ncbi:histidine kinase [Malaciobacter halophilus]|uniref:histidine kinase n=1 Tax=Malaciobacter halophilus TaxID=197482 RepID=A0A2N1J098_9BACT|nr:histidine kinase [Malaciobacter halophilus]
MQHHYKVYKLQKISYLILLLYSLNLFAKELEKVSLQLSWFNQFQFAGYYIAKEKGFYKDVGLEVEIRNFDFGINVPNEVNNKKATFGVGRETLLLDRSNKKNIVALYAIFQASPLILLSLDDTNINSISDFKNKKIMTTIDDAGEVSLKAMISSQNVDFKKLHFLEHSHNIMDLVNKNTDVMSAYISKTPYDLQQMGIGYNVFYPKDYGFDMYSDFLFTNEDEIKNNEQRVIDFKNASLRGWEYAFTHIHETANLIFKKYNEQNIPLDALIYEGKELKKLAYYSNSNLGDIKKEKVQRIFDLYNVMGLAKNSILIDDFIYSDNYTLFTKGEKNYIKNRSAVNICINPNLISLRHKSNEEYTGILKDFLELINKSSGLNFNLVDKKSWKSTLEAVKSKECDIISTAAKVKEIKNSLNYTKSYIDIPLVIATKKEVSFIDNVSSLKGKKIGVVKDITFIKFLEKYYPYLNIVEVNSVSEGLKKVSTKKLFAQIDTITTISDEIQENFLSELKISGKIKQNLPLYFAVRKDDNFLLNILNKSIDSIDDFEKQKIINKWISIEYKKGFDYSLVWKILLVFIIIFSILLYRQRLLNKVNTVLKDKVDEKTKELKKLNESLERRVEQEVQNNRDKDRLLSQQVKMAAMGEMLENIAHQWRQPLSIISTTSSGIVMQKNAGILKDDFLVKSMDTINDTAQYLSKTIEDFRNFYEPNKNIVGFNIKTIYTKTLNIISFKYENLNIKFFEKIEDVDMIGLDSELIQVVINLLNNSKDALETNNDEIERFIFVEIFSIKQNLIIKIRDNAGGVDEEIIDRIFEPYFTTKHKAQGTGIGLYMSQEIISKHMNGEINVCNKEFKYNNKNYKGAQFTIKIPLKLQI